MLRCLGKQVTYGFWLGIGFRIERESNVAAACAAAI